MPEFTMKNGGDREAVRAEAREAMGAAISEAEAEYRPDGRLYDAMEPPPGKCPGNRPPPGSFGNAPMNTGCRNTSSTTWTPTKKA